jgi:hypothetical protein
MGPSSHTQPNQIDLGCMGGAAIAGSGAMKTNDIINIEVANNTYRHFVINFEESCRIILSPLYFPQSSDRCIHGFNKHLLVLQ